MGGGGQTQVAVLVAVLVLSSHHRLLITTSFDGQKEMSELIVSCTSGKDRGERLLIERVVVDVGCHMCFRVVKFERIELTS